MLRSAQDLPPIRHRNQTLGLFRLGRSRDFGGASRKSGGLQDSGSRYPTKFLSLLETVQPTAPASERFTGRKMKQLDGEGSGKKMAGGVPKCPANPKGCELKGSSSVMTAVMTDRMGRRSRSGLALQLRRWQCGLADVCGRARRTQPNRTSIRDGNRLNACCHESAYHSYHQNRDPDCQLRIHLYLHCGAP